MTVEQLEANYGHHHPDFQEEVAEAFGSRGRLEWHCVYNQRRWIRASLRSCLIANFDFQLCLRFGRAPFGRVCAQQG
jgi:hypothetical protein